MSLIGTVFSIRSRNKSIFAVHCPNKIDICNMTTIFFCNGFIIYITYVIPMDHDTHLVWKIKLKSVHSKWSSLQYAFSTNFLQHFHEIIWSFWKIYFICYFEPPCQAPNERATTLTRSAISNETQQIMPEKCPVK